MKLRLFILMCGCLLVFTPVSQIHAGQYTFTPIATTEAVFSAFGPAAINDSGMVVFYGTLQTGGNGIYLWDGGSPITVTDTTGPFTSLDITPTINNGGTVAFNGYTNAGNWEVNSWNSGTIVTIYDDTGMFSFLGSPDINDSGTIAFYAGLDVGSDGIFSGNGGPTTTIADSGSFDIFHGKPAINNSDSVAFIANPADTTDQGVFLGSGGPITTVADTSGLFNGFSDGVALNDGTVVAFQATFDTLGGEQHGIFTAHDGDVTPITDSSGLFDGFLNPTVNDLGEIAFSASFDAGGGGIFTGADPVLDKVIEIGDTLDGLIVTGISFGEIGGNHGLNNAGQLAFWARLSDGNVGLYLASPVPLPPAFWLFGSGLIGLIGISRRRKAT